MDWYQTYWTEGDIWNPCISDPTLNNFSSWYKRRWEEETGHFSNDCDRHWRVRQFLFMFICNNLPSPREKSTHLRKLYQKKNSLSSFLSFYCICLYANSCNISAKNSALFWFLRCKEHHYKQSLQSCSVHPATVQKSPSGTVLQGLDELSIKLCTRFPAPHCEFSKYWVLLLWPGVTLGCIVSIFVWWENSVSSFKRPVQTAVQILQRLYLVNACPGVSYSNDLNDLWVVTEVKGEASFLYTYRHICWAYMNTQQPVVVCFIPL